MRNESKELISIIIPVYNAERYLDDCIQSVLNQTYNYTEIVLVDDGSKDKSAAICDSYANNYENIKVLHNDNQGPAASRKYGIESSNGSLVMFIDADDWIECDMLEVMARELNLSEADIVTCFYADVYNNGKRVVHQTFQESAMECNTFSESIYEIHGTRFMDTGPWAKLYKKDLFRNVDFREHITIGEDYTMLLQVLHNASKVRMLNQVFYNRRIYGGNISRSGFTQRHKLALDNYLTVRTGLIRIFPEYKTEILGYHIEYEMAVITAMCRNRNFDKEVIRKLRNDLILNKREIIFQCKMPLYMKICAVMIAYTPRLFCNCFMLISRLTGR